MHSTNVHEILTLAAVLIEKTGWSPLGPWRDRGEYRPPAWTGNHCILTAIYTVSGGHNPTAANHLWQHIVDRADANGDLDELTQYYRGGINGWEFVDGRTQADVIEMLLGAADTWNGPKPYRPGKIHIESVGHGFGEVV